MRFLFTLAMAALILAFYAAVGVDRLPDTGAFPSPGPGFGAGALHGYFWPFNLLASFLGDSGVYEDFPAPGYLGGFVLGVGLLIVGNATIFLAHASGRGSGGSPSE
jgi:hypothetical protein